MLGVEHNAREHRLLVDPEAVTRLLEAVPELWFVWDLNHAEPEQSAVFAALHDRLSLVHASDTPLPATNHHLPIGRGTVDFSVLRAVSPDVPVILEIGGLPVSGGPGFDTDAELIASLASPSGLTRRGQRLGGAERVSNDAEHALAPALDDRDEAAELEPRQPDPPRAAHDLEAEVREKVVREHRLVHAEALVARLALVVAVGERLETPGTAIARLADRSQEERLQHPRRATPQRGRRT